MHGSLGSLHRSGDAASLAAAARVGDVGCTVLALTSATATWTLVLTTGAVAGACSTMRAPTRGPVPISTICSAFPHGGAATQDTIAGVGDTVCGAHRMAGTPAV